MTNENGQLFSLEEAISHRKTPKDSLITSISKKLRLLSIDTKIVCMRHRLRHCNVCKQIPVSVDPQMAWKIMRDRYNMAHAHSEILKDYAYAQKATITRLQRLYTTTHHNTTYKNTTHQKNTQHKSTHHSR